jgi:hypothetical protein
MPVSTTKRSDGLIGDECAGVGAKEALRVPDVFFFAVDGI